MRRTGDTDEPDGHAAGLTFAPVVWLLGKVQSGKTSIIRTLTGAGNAEIGDGFKACTKSSLIFDYPDEAPVIRFLDTRGLGEARYDPAEDIAFCQARAHLLLCTMRAMDVQQEIVLRIVRQVRAASPDWPVVVAQTTLHEAYPGRPHPQPFPYASDGQPTAKVPSALARTLNVQRALFADLPDTGALRFAPIDFTRADDRLEPADYGLQSLKTALAEAAPMAVLGAIEDKQVKSGRQMDRRGHALILGHAMAAAAADLVPLAGIVAVPGVQARMLSQLGELHGVAWDRRRAAEFAGALGTGTLARLLGSFGARELAKFIPVYGQSVGAAAAAAASFASTYALGKAAVYYLSRRHLGREARAGVLEAYKQAFATAFSMARAGPAAKTGRGAQ